MRGILASFFLIQKNEATFDMKHGVSEPLAVLAEKEDTNKLQYKRIAREEVSCCLRALIV